MFCLMASPSSELVQRARDLLAEGHALLVARAHGEAAGALADVAASDDLLALYERLRGRLAAIADDEVGDLLDEISEAVAGLSRLADDLDRVHGLRAALGKPLR